MVRSAGLRACRTMTPQCVLILRDAAKRPLLRMRKKNRNRYRTTPEMKPGLRRGGFISFFRKQCASLPTYPGRA